MYTFSTLLRVLKLKKALGVDPFNEGSCFGVTDARELRDYCVPKPNECPWEIKKITWRDVRKIAKEKKLILRFPSKKWYRNARGMLGSSLYRSGNEIRIRKGVVTLERVYHFLKEM